MIGVTRRIGRIDPVELIYILHFRFGRFFFKSNEKGFVTILKDCGFTFTC